MREFDGEKYVMERSLVADVSLVKAYKADKAGNLVYRKTAQLQSECGDGWQDHRGRSKAVGRNW